MSDNLIERAKRHLGSEWPTTTQSAKRNMICELVARVEQLERMYKGKCAVAKGLAEGEDGWRKRAEQAEAKLKQQED